MTEAPEAYAPSVPTVANILWSGEVVSGSLPEFHPLAVTDDSDNYDPADAALFELPPWASVDEDGHLVLDAGIYSVTGHINPDTSPMSYVMVAASPSPEEFSGPTFPLGGTVGSGVSDFMKSWTIVAGDDWHYLDFYGAWYVKAGDPIPVSAQGDLAVDDVTVAMQIRATIVRVGD